MSAWHECDTLRAVQVLSAEYGFDFVAGQQLLQSEGLLLGDVGPDSGGGGGGAGGSGGGGRASAAAGGGLAWQECDAWATVESLGGRFGFDFGEAERLLLHRRVLSLLPCSSEDEQEGDGGAAPSGVAPSGAATSAAAAFAAVNGVEAAAEQERILERGPRHMPVVPEAQRYREPAEGSADWVVRTIGSVGGYRDGAAAEALISCPSDVTRCPRTGRLFFTDTENRCIRALSADLRTVATMCTRGVRTVTAIQALPDGRVLYSDREWREVRALSADMAVVVTVAGSRPTQGELSIENVCCHRDGAALEARFNLPCGMCLLADGRVLICDRAGRRVRMLSADLQTVSTVAGDGTQGHRDGPALQARLLDPMDLCMLPDGRVVISEFEGCLLRMLSADLQTMSTVVGNASRTLGYRDGPAADAQCNHPTGVAALADGTVLFADCGNACVRQLSADLTSVSTFADGSGDFAFDLPLGICPLPDGRVVVCDSNNHCLRVLERGVPEPPPGSAIVPAVADEGLLGKRTRE
jgi:hypothetical protein